jgi:hypothetical protein
MIPDEEDPEYEKWLREQSGEDDIGLDPALDPNDNRPIAKPEDRSELPEEHPDDSKVMPDIKFPPPSKMIADTHKNVPVNPATTQTTNIVARHAPNESPGFDMNDAGLVLSLFADMAINKGRGGADIIKWYQGGKDRELDQKLKEARAAQLFAQAAAPHGGHGLTPEQLDLQRQRLLQGDRRLANQEAAQQVSAGRAKLDEQKWADLNTIGSDRQKALVDWMVKNHVAERSQIENLPASEITKAWPAANQYIENSGDIGEAREHQAAETAAAVGQASMPSRVETARRISEATLPYDEQRARAGAEARATADITANQNARAGFKIPGLITDDPDVWAANAADDTTRRNMVNSAAAYRKILTGIDRMIELRKKYGVQIPGEIQGEYELGKTAVIGGVTKLGETGVLNEGEWQRYSKVIPGITPSLNDLGAIFGKDISLEQLKGVRRALKGAVDAGLFQWGAHYDYGSLPEYDVPGNLGVTDEDGPKVNKVLKKKMPSAPNGRVRVRDPKSGRTATVDDTPELKKRIQAGVLEYVQ